MATGHQHCLYAGLGAFTYFRYPMFHHMFCFEHCKVIPWPSIQIPYLHTSFGSSVKQLTAQATGNGAGIGEPLGWHLFPLLIEREITDSSASLFITIICQQSDCLSMYSELSLILFLKIMLLLFSQSPFGWNSNCSAVCQSMPGLSQITFMVIGWCKKRSTGLLWEHLLMYALSHSTQTCYDFLYCRSAAGHEKQSFCIVTQWFRAVETKN